MRFITYIFVLFLITVSSYFVYFNSSYIEVIYGNWVISTPLWIIVLVCILLLVLIIFNMFIIIKNLVKHIKKLFIGSSEYNINKAWIALAEGDWMKAETKMLKAAKIYDNNPWHLYLLAAKSAQKLYAYDRRDNYLSVALRMNPNAKVAIGIMQAEFQYNQGQYKSCLETINSLYKNVAHNKILLSIAIKIYSALGKWQDIIELLYPIKKMCIFNNEEYKSLAMNSYEHLLHNKAKDSGKQSLIAAWNNVSRDMQSHSYLIKVYCTLLLKLNDVNEAESVIRNAIKKQWNSELVKLYGSIMSSNIERQIAIAENWLKHHPNDAILLLTLARFCIECKLWNKARDYLESSIKLSIHNNPEAYAELGRLLEISGELDKALEYYKTCIKQVL